MSAKDKDQNVFSLYIDYVNKDKNFPVIVVNHIGKNTSSSILNFFTKKENKHSVKWIIVGPPTCFDFDFRCQLVFNSRMSLPSEIKDCMVKIPDYETHMFNTCALKATECFPRVEPSTENNNSNFEETIRYNPDYYPSTSTIAIGVYFARYQKSAWLFAYDLKNNKIAKDEAILERLALHTWQQSCQSISFDEMSIELEKRNHEIFFADIKNKNISTLSDSNLTLVNQIFDCTDCTNCEHHGIININSDKIICRQLNLKFSDLHRLNALSISFDILKNAVKLSDFKGVVIEDKQC
ncbi:hypothetical protein C2G38_2228253 [Gigaspora rosea]|uniref:Uncharacterized protein n=1 Tax=Gigaspora rosea TaxID=44941 RepID=A0A397TZQ8_9GLOM|nr:hypothetical protein C2G38_2228253 [Gigaspora rosea]